MNDAEKYAQKLHHARKEVAGITQSEAESYLKHHGLSVSARSISKWENGDGPPKQVDGDVVIELLEQYEEGWRGSPQTDPIYPTVASAGDGSFLIGEESIGYISGEDALSRPGRDVYWVPVRGDSMKGTIPKNTLVPILKLDDPKLRQDDVYLFRLEDAVQVKRLQRRPGQRIRVISDNENYDNFSIALDEGTDFEILGRVLV